MQKYTTFSIKFRKEEDKEEDDVDNDDGDDLCHTEICCQSLLSIYFSGPGFGGLSKVFVARHSPSKTLVVVKQTNVDVKNAEQLEELKV